MTGSRNIGKKGLDNAIDIRKEVLVNKVSGAAADASKKSVSKESTVSQNSTNTGGGSSVFPSKDWTQSQTASKESSRTPSKDSSVVRSFPSKESVKSSPAKETSTTKSTPLKSSPVVRSKTTGSFIGSGSLSPGKKISKVPLTSPGFSSFETFVSLLNSDLVRLNKNGQDVVDMSESQEDVEGSESQGKSQCQCGSNYEKLDVDECRHHVEKCAEKLLRYTNGVTPATPGVTFGLNGGGSPLKTGDNLFSATATSGFGGGGGDHHGHSRVSSRNASPVKENISVKDANQRSYELALKVGYLEMLIQFLGGVFQPYIGCSEEEAQV